MVTQIRAHYTEPYVLNPQHPVTINLIGAGGNGSQMLTQLARIDQAIKRLGHPGLHVTLFDDDQVTDANIGRQMFSPADIGLNKAVVLITRMNQYFGTSWKAIPHKYNAQTKAGDERANFFITCVDSVSARLEIWNIIKKFSEGGQGQPFRHAFYWMDLGNSQSTGQFILGSLKEIEQPKRSKTLDPVNSLPVLFEKYPDFAKQRTVETEPSCSLAEALTRQDLFINSLLVQVAAATLWKMFREGKINHHGAFINLKTLDIAPIYL